MKNFVSALTILVFSVFTANIAFAQQTTFRINYDIANLDIPGSIINDSNDDFVFAGTNATLFPYGNITKIDPVGGMLWSKRISASIATTLTDIIEVSSTNGGGYLAVGDNVLLRVNSNGNLVWAQDYDMPDLPGSNESSLNFNTVIETSDGNFAIGGSVRYFWDGTSASTDDSTHCFAMKVNSVGDIIWDRTIVVDVPNPDEHSYLGIAETSDGYIFAGYSSRGDGTRIGDEDQNYYRYGIISKFSTTGTEIFTRRFGNDSRSEYVRSIKTLNSGTNVILTGERGDNGYILRFPATGTPSSFNFGHHYSSGFIFPEIHQYTEVMETQDGNYAVMGSFIVPLSFEFNAVLAKINSSNGGLIFGKAYTSGLSSILPEGGAANDGGYFMYMTAQQFTGFNYHTVKADQNGDLNNSDCPEASYAPTRSSYNPGLVIPTYTVYNNRASDGGFVPSITNITPNTVIDCRTIVCNAPPVPTVSASGNNICPGTSVTISATGSGSNVTYDVFTQSSGGTSIGTAPISVSPSTTTNYYIEAYENSDPLCVTARDSVTVTVLPPPPAQPGTISGDNPACPNTSETYSVSAVSGASTYNWNVSGGGNSISGTGASANVNWGSTPGTYTISVSAENSCGTSNTRTLQVTVGDPPPAQPGAISGTIDPCPGSQNYSIGSVAGATNYNWNVSGGGSISGSGTSISVDWTTSGGPYTLSVTAVNDCGSSATRTLQVNVKEAAPTSIGAISGDTPVCFGTENYSVPSVPRATNYDWSLNGGGTITSGQNSNSININWTSAGTHTISVFAENDCGQTSTEILQVTVDSPPPAQPGNITGAIAPCPGTENYSIATVSGATNYTWSLSGGGNISNGQGGTAIDIDWTTSGGPYTLSVVAENSCGNSSARTIQVNVGDPAPSSIDTIGGDNLVCPGNATYTIPTVSGATNYDWAISAGGSISSGQNTNSIVVNWTTQGNYTVSVTAENSCGDITSTPKNVEVLSGVPATPSISGPAGVCPGVENYSISAVNGASGYSWSLSGGGNIISGTGTNAIQVDWGSTAGTYTLSVTADNICGSSNTATLQVNVTSGPPSGLPSIAGPNPACPGTEAYIASGVTGASTYTWSVDAGGSITSGQGTSSINIDWANSGGPFTIEVFTENSCGSGDTNTLAVFVDSLPQFDGDTIVGEINPCPGTENYSISSVANATAYNWTVSSGGTITSGQGTNSISVDWTTYGGPYTLSVVPTNNCGDGTAVTQNITVQPGAPTTPPNITGEVTICEGSGTELYVVDNVANADTYVWTMLNGGGTIVSGQGTDSVLIDWTGTPGNYQFSVRAENNCGFSADIFHSVNIIAGAPAQPVAINGPIEICPGTENYSIASVQDANSYNWTLSSGGNIVSGQGTENISVDWIASGGPYTLSVIAENTCGTSAAQTLDITVLQSPTAPSITTSGDTICEGSSTTITASGSTGGTITYGIYDDQTGGNFLGNSPLGVNPENTTTYYVQASNESGCTYAGGRVPVEIVVLSAPNAASITADNQSVCSGDSATFTATASGSSISWWSAEDGGTLLGTGSEFNTGAVTQSTTYYVSTTSANGCEQITDRTTVNVNVRELPFLSLGTDAENNSIFINEALTAIADPDYYDLYEFFLNGESVQNDSIHNWAASTFEDGDVISVISTDAGCVGNEAEITITVNDYPNAFTPNGDGRNDVFLEGFDLTIINRWGQELYQGTDGWDGTFNGKRVAPGTYFYILKVQDITDTENVLKGSVLVSN